MVVKGPAPAGPLACPGAFRYEVAGMEPIRVFVCDDAPAFRDLLRLALEQDGALAIVGEADDGAHLEDIAAARPDVVLLDVAGANADGMEMLDRIRANPHVASTPIVIVTAKKGADDILAGYKFGADYYLTKPITARTLLRGIGLVLGREFPE